jgi:hypothetical protein
MRENMNSSESPSPLKELFNSKKLDVSNNLGASQISQNVPSE